MSDKTAQGVVEVMRLVDAYAQSQNLSYTKRADAEQALTAIVQERDALKADKAHLRLRRERASAPLASCSSMGRIEDHQGGAMKVRDIKRRLNKSPSPMQNRYSRRARRWAQYMTFEQAEKLLAALERHAAGGRS